MEVVYCLLAALFQIGPVENRLNHWNTVAVFRIVGVAADIGIALDDGADGCSRKFAVIAGEGDHHREENGVHFFVDEI